MNDNEIIKADDILSKFDFFGGQRAGRELWNEKPVDVQDEDIKNFSKDVAFLKDFINRQNAEIERLTTMHSEMCIGMKRLKSEAYGKFAERLKKTCFNAIYRIPKKGKTVDISEANKYITDLLRNDIPILIEHTKKELTESNE